MFRQDDYEVAQAYRQVLQNQQSTGEESEENTTQEVETSEDSDTLQIMNALNQVMNPTSAEDNKEESE